jgi:hypothetical protein
MAINYVELCEQARKAANEAGTAWLAQGLSWYPCGNAHVAVRDNRSRHAKEMKRLGLVRSGGRYCVELNSEFRHRQEYYLRMACAKAALEVLKKGGIDCLEIWEYID